MLLDTALPEADGVGLLERILKLTDASLVLLSGPGENRARDLALAFEFGADDYIIKPLPPSELVDQLDQREAPTVVLSGCGFGYSGI